MQTKPNGWPRGSYVEEVPDFQVRADAPWAPESTASVASVSLRRELVGGGLPGAARGGSGFSVASGSFVVPQSSKSPMTPWAGAVYRVMPGGEVTVEAAHDSATLQLGSFIVAEVGGADSSGDLSIPIVESQRRLDGPCTYVWQYDSTQATMDASEVIRAIATETGYDTSLIQDSGSRIRGIFDVAGKSNRQVIQDIARSTMGAAWQDEAGRLVYRNAESMRTGRPVETIIADEQLEDLPWRISREDTADRIELTYTAADLILDAAATITLWEATERVRVAAGETVVLNVEIRGSTDRVAAWLPIWDTTTAGTSGLRMSRWGASRNFDGGGERPATSDLRIDTTVTGPSTISIRITNRADYALWLVDGSGNPCLILRTTHHVTPGEEVTISTGATAKASINAFKFECGSWVQDAAFAQNMLDWLWAQMSMPLGVIPTVNTKPDLARQIGDIVTLTEEKITEDHVPLKSKALITGMSIDADAGGYSQVLTLALLAVTFDDFNTWARAQPVTTFGDFDSYLVGAGITTFEQFDAWAAQSLVPLP